MINLKNFALIVLSSFIAQVSFAKIEAVGQPPVVQISNHAGIDLNVSVTCGGSEPWKELVASANQTLSLGVTDCEGHALFVALQTKGFATRKYLLQGNVKYVLTEISGEYVVLLDESASGSPAPRP